MLHKMIATESQLESLLAARISTWKSREPKRSRDFKAVELLWKWLGIKNEFKNKLNKLKFLGL
jgi:hypothetical protein